MKKGLAIACLCLCASACLLGGLSGAAAWFVEKATVSSQSGLVGESQGAYFARGEGTSSSPFIINKPIHLYNLAWLQYIGYFNDENAPYYFALDPLDDQTTLDMAGWVLPPIGTSLYPFIGNFEGNGETIANLTTDNVIGTNHIVKKPTIITAAATDANGILKTYQKAGESTPATFLNTTLDVVGFFGIIGQYSGMAPVSASYADANSINFVALDNLSVKSASSSTLVGLACGYDNATLNGVAINNSNLYAANGATAITTITNNLSDYSLVGYATDDALGKCFVREDTTSLPKINNPNTQSGGQNWGGSIDMLHLYTQLAEIRDAHSGTASIPATTAFSYPTSKTFVDGVEDMSRRVNKTDARSVVNGRNTYYYRYEGNKLTYNDPEAGNPDYLSLTFARELNQSYTSYLDGEDQSYKYNCLYGAKTFNFNNATTVNNYETRPLFRINNGTQYMTVTRQGNNYNIGSTTTPGNGTTFYLDGSNRIICTISNTSVYLRNNSGTLAATTTASSGATWTWDSTNHNLYTGTYYLNYSSGWQLVQNDAYPYYTIRANNAAAGSGYLARSGSYGITTSNEAGAQKWGYGSVKTSRHTTPANGYYDYSKGTTSSGYSYVLGFYGTSSLQVDSDTNTFLVLESGEATGTGKLVADGRYLTYNNNSLSSTTTSGSATQFEVVYHPVETPNYGINLVDTGQSKEISTSSTTENASYTTNATYFPLLMEPNTYKPMNEYVDPTDPGGQKKFNTGYIVAGCNDTTSSTYQQVWGDIRISAYPYSALSDRTNIHTRTNYLNGAGIVSSGWTTLRSVTDAANIKLQKYTSSYSKMQTLLQESSESGYIHGLHFMSAQISKSHLATIGRAVVLDGKTPQVMNDKGVLEDKASVYDQYQVPEDSIDFNLKSYGYINFFAGTYFSGNNCFFSLHQVTRDGNNDIDTINQISEVYCPEYRDSAGNYLLGDEDHPYIYKYSGTPTKWSSYTKVDGKWQCTTTTTEPSHGPLLFDCSWITAPDSLTNDCLYYFEVPVNAGEYALGSVSGKNGAYLLYLDIGAGAANYKDVTQDENIVINITELVFPVGVDFVDLSNNTSTLDVAAPGGSSATVAVKPTTTAVATTYTYATNTTTKQSTLALTKAGNDPPNMPASTFSLEYEAESTSTSYVSTPLSLDASVTYTITVEKEIIQNYNPNIGSGTLTFTYVEKYTITNGKANRKIQLPTAGGNGASWSVTSGNVTCAAGLVTFTGTGTAVVQTTWSNSTEIGDASNWTPLSSNNPDGAETSPIVKFHFIDYSSSSATPPNVVVTYTYSGTRNEQTGRQSFVYNLSVVNNSGKDIILVIDALKLSFTTESTTTYTATITYGGNTYSITAVGNTFTIPSAF